MTTLHTCPTCEGFTPAELTACPHCETAVSREARIRERRLLSLVKLAQTIGGGGFLAMTLMACYGLPPCDGSTTGACAPACMQGTTDRDGDGFCTPDDCDDTDASIFPTAPDPRGDDIDQNCDGVDGVRRTQ